MGNRGSGDRIAWIDVTRGLGILLVVAGHVFTNPDAHHAIFLFHMPLFFFLSGMMHRKGPLAELVAKRAMSLLVPYAAFLGLAVVLDLIAFAVDGVPSLPYRPVWKFAARLLYGGSALGGALGVAWFLPCLFLTNIIYAAVERAAGGVLKPAMLAFAAAAGLIAYLLPPLITPLGIGQMPFAVLFFWAGAVWGVAEPRGWMAVIGFAGYLAGALWAPSIDMKYMAFGWPGISVVVALCGSITLMAVGAVTSKSSKISAPLVSVGRAALTIMFLHMVVMIHLRPYLPEPVLYGVALVAPYLTHLAFARMAWSRTIFLGQRRPVAVTRAEAGN